MRLSMLCVYWFVDSIYTNMANKDEYNRVLNDVYRRSCYFSQT